MPNLDNLFNLLAKRGKPKDLSEQTGISTGNISDWKSGRSKPSADALIKIADYYSCSVDYLLGRTDMKYFVKTPANVIQIPVLQQKAAAGLGKEATDESFEPPEWRWFYQEQVPKGAEYGIIIEGDSMEPRFHDGQTIFVKLSNDCNESWFGIFCITDDDKDRKSVV